eukprot:Opistho-2@72434
MSSSAPVARKTIHGRAQMGPPAYPPPRGSTAQKGLESFVVLSRSQVGRQTSQSGEGESSSPGPQSPIAELINKDSITYRIKVANRLFDLMSGISEADHPLCTECADLLLAELEQQIADVMDDREYYKKYLEKVSLTSGEAALGGASQSLERAEKSALEREEERLRAELLKIEQERESIARETTALSRERERLDELESEYWREANEYQRQLQEYVDERDSVEVRYQHASQQLDKLKRTNVYNDAFHIYHDGHFGTINNFRLGRLTQVPVDWSEVNAAWGQTVLLLHTMTERMGFKFKRYRLVPLGSFSRLERLEDNMQLELYGSGGLKYFLTNRFDTAMVAFLDCLQQFKEYIESRDPHFKLPYQIVKDKIGDLTIKLQFNNDETWTKALKYMLTNLKWCLAWVCKMAR